MRLGIDIGGTKTAALVLDDSGGIVAQVAAPSGRGNAQVLATAVSVADRAAALVGGWAHIEPRRRLHARARRPADRLGAARGQPRGATPSTSPAASRPRTGRRPSVDNDVKAAALGAHHAVRPEVADGTTAYLNVGTGLAAAIVRRGEVVRGAGGAAGEIGHLPVGSRRALLVRAGRAASRPSPRAPRCTGCGRGPRPTCSPRRPPATSAARAVVATLAHGIALAVQVLVVTGAELVVIGGGLARDRAELEAALAADIDARAAGLAVPAPARPRVAGSGCSTATCRWPPSVRRCCRARPSRWG